MTTIERLWDKAKDDPVQKRIHEALSVEVTAVCMLCDGESKLDRVSGCYVCQDCGERVCGDG